MNTHKLYANQFPSGTIININEYADVGVSYIATMCEMLPHNRSIIYGRRVSSDGTAGDVECIGSTDTLQRKLSELVDLNESGGLYELAVAGGYLVPGKGPLVKKAAPLSYQHFPEGTVFVIHKYLRPYDGKDNYSESNRTFTAKSIIHNGVGSYCIETTTTNNEVYGEDIACGFYTINVSHVEKIIKRGDGVVSVNSAQFNGRQYKKHIQHKSPIDRECGSDAGGSKTNYTAFGVLSIINQAVAKLNLSTDQELDGDKLNHAFMMQTFVKMKPHHYAKANRKRTDRWVKQNINRFLMTKRKAIEIDVGERRELYEYDRCD